jgi:CRP/FNR family transcriptional regulator
MLEGEMDAAVFVVRQGAVRVYRTGVDGREQTLIRLGPGSAFNMPAAFLDRAAAPGGVAAPASAVTLAPAQVAVISVDDFCETVIHTPELALIVLRDLAIKVNHLTDLSRDLGLLTVRARLARFLLDHGHSPDGPLPEGAQTRWTHHEIAAQIGTVREVVSRTMRSFVKDGLIKLERHRIVVLDRDALMLEAGS